MRHNLPQLVSLCGRKLLFDEIRLKLSPASYICFAKIPPSLSFFLRCCFTVIKPVNSIGAGAMLISSGLINSPFLQLSSSLDARLHRYRNLSPIFHLIYGDSQKVYPIHTAVKYQSDALIRSCVTSSLIGSDYDEQTQRSRVNFAIISFFTTANMSSLTLEKKDTNW